MEEGKKEKREKEKKGKKGIREITENWNNGRKKTEKRKQDIEYLVEERKKPARPSCRAVDEHVEEVLLVHGRP